MPDSIAGQHTAAEEEEEAMSTERGTARGRSCQGLAVAAVVALIGAAPALAQTEWDFSKVVGPDACAECHKVEAEIWRGTHHFKTFTEMPRSDKARTIADKMGVRRIKSESVCLNCHFTTVVKDGERDPIAGISCESCHSPGKDWYKVHGGFSGKKKETETAAEAQTRWAKSEAAGMIRPKQLYSLAKNCYNCHVVPREELVNKGGHPAGSDFELVAWSQGEVRHNVWYTEGKANKEASPERKRLMYVVGQAVELETALRAVGKATVKDTYAVSMAKRAQAAKIQLAKIAAALDAPELKAMVAAAEKGKLKLNNEAQLTAAADAVADGAQKIAANYDGSTFGAVDAMLPSPDKYKGKPAR
jgi:Cytochrome c554 and c-prime